jgi:hypothetical protein
VTELPGGSVAPATFEQRIGAVRHRRMASQLLGATYLALWIAGLTGILAIVGAGLLDFH